MGRGRMVGVCGGKRKDGRSLWWGEEGWLEFVVGRGRMVGVCGGERKDGRSLWWEEEGW